MSASSSSRTQSLAMMYQLYRLPYYSEEDLHQQCLFHVSEYRLMSCQCTLISMKPLCGIGVKTSTSVASLSSCKVGCLLGVQVWYPILLSQIWYTLLSIHSSIIDHTLDFAVSIVT